MTMTKEERAVIEAAERWYESCPFWDGYPEEEELEKAIEAYRRARESRPSEERAQQGGESDGKD